MANVPVTVSTAFGSGAVLGSLVTNHLREMVKREPTEQTFVKSALWQKYYNDAPRVPAAYRWQWPVKAINTSRATAYSGAQVNTPTGSDDITMASEQVAHYRCPIQLLRTEIIATQGGSALFDYAAAKMQSSKDELATTLGTDTWSSSSVTSPAYGLQGVRLYLPTDPTASVAYNSVNGAAGVQPYWRNSTITGVGSFATNGVDKMDRLSALIHSAGGEWETAYTDLTTHTYLKKAARTHYNINTNIGESTKQIAKFGFSAVEFEQKGVFAESTSYLADATGIIYFVPARPKFELRVVQGVDFNITEMVPLTAGGQSGMVAWIEFSGQFCALSRRDGGQMSGITA